MCFSSCGERRKRAWVPGPELGTPPPPRGGQAQSRGPSSASRLPALRQVPKGARAQAPRRGAARPVCSGPPTSLGCETTAQEARASVFLINNLFPLPHPRPGPARPLARLLVPLAAPPVSALRVRIPGALGAPGRGCPRGGDAQGVPAWQAGAARCHQGRRLGPQAPRMWVPLPAAVGSGQPSDFHPLGGGGIGGNPSLGPEHPRGRSRHPLVPRPPLSIL